MFSWSGWTSLAAIGALIAAVATIIYTRYTYELLKATRKSIDRQNKVHEFEIFTSLSADLETKQALRLHNACKTNTLKIDVSLGEALTSQYRGETTTSGSGLRHNLLNPLEKMPKYWRDGLISTSTIDNTLGYFILNIGNCTTLVQHIHQLRSVVYNNPKMYGGFESLYIAIYNDLPEVEKSKYRSDFSISA